MQQAAESGSAADQMAALLGPEQKAALLCPSWKSNQFNLKQVGATQTIEQR